MSLTEPKKSLGQHWLSDPGSLQAMCDAADVQAGNVVLEIGPGTGELTQKLINRKAEIVALEIDRQLIQTLQKRFANFPSSTVFIQEGDIRTYDLGNMTDEYKIVANIPYYLTANLFRILTTGTTHKPSIAALLVQKEVAERVAAKPGKLSALSVFVQFYYEVNLGQIVPAKLFTPPPKVDSQILILHLRNKPLFAGIDEQRLFQIVKAGFSAPRKKLRSSLAGGLRRDKIEIEKLLESAKINPDSRAQELSLSDWCEIMTYIN